MASESLYLERQRGHNMIWKSDDFKLTIITSKTPSDVNWYRQVKRDIRRKKKQLGVQ